MRYFDNHPGGMDDVNETFELFSEVMSQSIIPRLNIPELDAARDLLEDPSSLLDEVRKALFDSEDMEEVRLARERLKKFRDDIRELADDRGIVLALGRNGSEESREANKGNDPLEYRILNVLHVCADKLIALLAYKIAEITFSRN